MRRINLLSIIILIVIINAIMLFLYHKYMLTTHNAQPMQPTIATPTITDTLLFQTTRINAITEAVKRIEPAVVSVNVLKSVVVRGHMHLNLLFPGLFGGPLTQEISSIGSGVLMSHNGYIITNAHVVEGATQIKVVMTNGAEYDAQLIGLDAVHDVAIIKIEVENYHYAQLGKSDDLMIGEWSIAMGNPYGFLIKDSKPSVSVGVISAINRNFTTDIQSKVYQDMIQTDATINPGNSGGPLVNIAGEVIGINSFIFSETGGSVGIGFAIPIDRVKKITEELIAFGRIRVVYIGLEMQDITPLMARYYGLRSLDGVIVEQVLPSSPASKAGVRRGDIIMQMGETAIRNMRDAEAVTIELKPGDTVPIRLLREGREQQISITAGDYR